jgi:cell division protein FtsB
MMDGIIFAIYTISLISAFICLWVKWDQDEDKYRMTALERKNQELQQQIDVLQQQIKRLGVKDPFTGKK